MVWIYDIETFPNYFCVTFKNYTTKEVKVFEIYKNKNDLDKICEFILFQNNLWLAGYNNYNFDNQLINYILQNQVDLTMYSGDIIAKSLYKLAISIIEEDNTEYRYSNFYRFLDLMKLGNLNQKSLKLVGTVFKWHKLQDLPLPIHEDIQKKDIPLILSYNLNDVEITERLFDLLKEQIKLRFEVSKHYDINAYSESDSGIANRMIEKLYSEATGLNKKDFKNLQTKRTKIFLADVIYQDVFFKTDILKEFLENLRSSIYFSNLPFLRRSIIFDNNKYVIGTGGIHTEDKGELFKSTGVLKIIDSDIASMYPTMIVNHNIKPKHIDKNFINIYKGMIVERLEAKHKGLKTISDVLKISINSLYGKFKSETHWLHDPLCALQVTINGQLYLLMLIEELVLNGFKVISANTDGIVTLVPTNKEDEFKRITSLWEQAMNFTLEHTEYRLYARRDINNYITIKSKDGSVKAKGDFIVPDVNNILNDPFILRRGFDKPIVAIALHEFFVNNVPIKDTIINHTDIYDFCTSQKTDKKFTNEYHTIKNNELNIEKLQQSVRYYISTNGGTLYKRSEEGKLINYCVGRTVTLFNDYFESDNYHIDYGYYISETQKIIDQIIKPQLTLF